MIINTPRSTHNQCIGWKDPNLTSRASDTHAKAPWRGSSILDGDCQTAYQRHSMDQHDGNVLQSPQFLDYSGVTENAFFYFIGRSLQNTEVNSQNVGGLVGVWLPLQNVI